MRERGHKNCKNCSNLPPILLAVKLSPLRLAVILHPSCLLLNSTLSAQRSSSTPAGGQHNPSPTSGHLQPTLLAVKLSPLHPAVIFHPPCWWPPSPLPLEMGDGRQEPRDERRETGDGDERRVGVVVGGRVVGVWGNKYRHIFRVTRQRVI